MTKFTTRDLYIRALSSHDISEPIAGYDGKYLIYPNGQIWNTHREQWQGQSDAGDYLKVTLSNAEGQQQLTVHRLVARHYLPNPNDYGVVNHIDGDKHNNHVKNLEWTCPVGNAQHALESGLRAGFMPIPMKRALLDRVLQRQETILEIAEEIGRHPVVLTKMVREQATKDGRKAEWETFSKASRREAAIRNISLNNENALTPTQVAELFQRAVDGERIIDLAQEVGRHSATLSALLKTYAKENEIQVDFRSRKAK